MISFVQLQQTGLPQTNRLLILAYVTLSIFVLDSHKTEQKTFTWSLL